MLAEHIAALRCPHCHGPLSAGQGALRCARGHGFDIARQGYVTLVPPAAPGDTAAMIAARVAVQDSGLFEPLAADLKRLIDVHASAARFLVDVGAGPGYYAAQLASAERPCLCVDSSKYAARRAARVHPSVAAVVADTGGELPLASGCADVLVDVFAPRNPAEFARIAAPRGLLLVAVPDPAHLAELRARVSMLTVQSGKWQKLLEVTGPYFELLGESELRWSRHLSRDLVRDLVLMGPSAFHTDADALERELDSLPEPFEVEAAVRIACLRVRG